MTVLTFPKRNKGRVRQSDSFESMGETALRRLRRSGEQTPANVATLFERHPHGHTATPEQALMVALFAATPDKQKATGRMILKAMEMAGDQQAARALMLLMGEG